MLPWTDVRELRTKAYRYRACDEPEEHVWVGFGDYGPKGDGTIILTLCSKCGRTPLEMLAEMEIR